MTIATCTRCSTSLHYHRGSLDDQLNPRRICKKCRVRALSDAQAVRNKQPMNNESNTGKRSKPFAAKDRDFLKGVAKRGLARQQEDPRDWPYLEALEAAKAKATKQ